MKISVIIPTYNEAANIKKLINLLFTASKGEDIEIII
ncbi:glycosyltransferase, partial [Acinetobacter baumannii]